MSLLTEVTKIKAEAKALELAFEADFQKACNEAYTITLEIQNLLNSKGAIVVESLIPNGATYAAEAQAAINVILPAIKILQGINSVAGVQALLQRLGSELTAIIHGGKHPISWYISAFEYVVFGSKTATVTPVTTIA